MDTNDIRESLAEENAAPISHPEQNRKRLRARMRMSVAAFLVFGALAVAYGRFHPVESAFVWIFATLFFTALALAQVWVFFAARASLRELDSVDPNQ